MNKNLLKEGYLADYIWEHDSDRDIQGGPRTLDYRNPNQATATETRAGQSHTNPSPNKSLGARRAFQAPNGLKVPAGWQPAGHVKHRIKYLRLGGPKCISSTKWLENTCGLAAPRPFLGPNGLKVPAGWQPSGHFKAQMA